MAQPAVPRPGPRMKVKVVRCGFSFAIVSLTSSDGHPAQYFQPFSIKKKKNEYIQLR